MACISVLKCMFANLVKTDLFLQRNLEKVEEREIILYSSDTYTHTYPEGVVSKEAAFS